MSTEFTGLLCLDLPPSSELFIQIRQRKGFFFVASKRSFTLLAQFYLQDKEVILSIFEKEEFCRPISY